MIVVETASVAVVRRLNFSMKRGKPSTSSQRNLIIFRLKFGQDTSNLNTTGPSDPYWHLLLDGFVLCFPVSLIEKETIGSNSLAKGRLDSGPGGGIGEPALHPRYITHAKTSSQGLSGRNITL